MYSGGGVINILASEIVKVLWAHPPHVMKCDRFYGQAFCFNPTLSPWAWDKSHPFKPGSGPYWIFPYTQENGN